MTLSRNRIIFAASLLAASLALPVLAAPPAGGTGTGNGVGGPPVGKQAEGGKEGKDGKGGESRERLRAGATERRNPEIWHRALQSLEANFTDDQKQQIAALRTDFEAKNKAWRDANGAKEKELTEKLRKAAQDGAADGQKGRPDPALIKEMQDLKATRPQPQEMQQKVWALLTPEQQATFKEHYDALQKEMAAKGGKRRGGEGGDGMEGTDRPGKRPPNGKPFQFEDAPKDAPKDAPAKNGDGKPSGS